MEHQLVNILKLTAKMLTNALKITVISTLEIVYTTKSIPKNANNAKLKLIVTNGARTTNLQIIASNLTVRMTIAELDQQRIKLNAFQLSAQTVIPLFVKLLNVYLAMIINQHAFALKNLVMMETNALLILAILSLDNVSTLLIKQVNALYATQQLIVSNMELTINSIQIAKFLSAILKDFVILKMLLILPNAIKINAALIQTVSCGQPPTKLQINASLLIAMQENASLVQLMI
jgi:hypothetical protein